MDDEVMTPDEAAAYLKLDAQTIRLYLREGRIKGSKIGRVWRVRRSALDAFIDEQAQR